MPSDQATPEVAPAPGRTWDDSGPGPDLAAWRPLTREAMKLALAGLIVVNVLNAYSISQQPWLDERLHWYLLDAEGSPGAWLASILLFMAAGLAIVCREVDPGRRHFWLGAAVVLTLGSIDEIAEAHERIDTSMGSQMTGSEDSLPVAWVIPGIILVAILGLLAWRARPNLPATTRRWLVLGVGIFLLGAVGFEILGALWVSENGKNNYTYCFLFTIEENLEKIGVLVLWVGLWRHALAISLARRAVAGTTA